MPVRLRRKQVLKSNRCVRVRQLASEGRNCPKAKCDSRHQLLYFQVRLNFSNAKILNRGLYVVSATIVTKIVGCALSTGCIWNNVIELKSGFAFAATVCERVGEFTSVARTDAYEIS